jgi:hypothetical protein
MRFGTGQAHILAQVIGQFGQRPALRQTVKAAPMRAKTVGFAERRAWGRARDAVRCAMAFPFDSLNTNGILISILDIWIALGHVESEWL